MRHVEINSPEWFRAWNALKAEGHVRSSYMMMYASEHGWNFKHTLYRDYVMIPYTPFQLSTMAQDYTAS